MRALALAGFGLFVLAGLFGAFGVREATVTATGAGGTRLAVTYPQVARAGLAVPFSITVARDGGFDAPIEVSVPTAYLLLFDENGTEPEPAGSTADDELTTWTFDPPDGDTLVVWFDVRLEPGVQWGKGASVRAVSGSDEVDVHLRTWVAP